MFISPSLVFAYGGLWASVACIVDLGVASVGIGVAQQRGEVALTARLAQLQVQGGLWHRRGRQIGLIRRATWSISDKKNAASSFIIAVSAIGANKTPIKFVPGRYGYSAREKATRRKHKPQNRKKL